MTATELVQFGRGHAPPEVPVLPFHLRRPEYDAGDAVEIERSEGDEAPAPSRPFPTVRILTEAPKPMPSLHVQDLVLDRDINFWAGHGGHGKSTLLLHLAVCVAAERAVFGALRVERPGPVLLVLPEDGEGAARMMLDAIVAGMGLSGEILARVHERLVMVCEDQAVDITTHATRLRDTALACGAVLVILDPLRNLLAGKPENDNDVAGTVCDTLRREVCRGAGASVILAHHFRKPGKEDSRDSSGAPSVHDARGGGGWPNAARLSFGVVKKDDLITVTAIKTNRLRANLQHDVTLTIDAEPLNHAHWLSCTLQSAAVAEPADFTPGVGRAINANERKALGALDDTHEPGLRLSMSGWCRAAGINTNTFENVRRRLLDAGLAIAEPTARMNPNGKSKIYCYGITDQGRAALTSGWGEGVKG